MAFRPSRLPRHSVELGEVLLHLRNVDAFVRLEAELEEVPRALAHVREQHLSRVRSDDLRDFERHDDDPVVVAPDNSSRAELRAAQADARLGLDDLDAPRNDRARYATRADRRLLLDQLGAIAALAVGDDTDRALLDGAQRVLRAPKADGRRTAGVDADDMARFEFVVEAPDADSDLLEPDVVRINDLSRRPELPHRPVRGYAAHGEGDAPKACSPRQRADLRCDEADVHVADAVERVADVGDAERVVVRFEPERLRERDARVVGGHVWFLFDEVLR